MYSLNLYACRITPLAWQTAWHDLWMLFAAPVAGVNLFIKCMTFCWLLHNSRVVFSVSISDMSVVKCCMGCVIACTILAYVVLSDVRFRTNELRQPYRFILCLQQTNIVYRKQTFRNEGINYRQKHQQKEKKILHVVVFRFLDLSRFNILLTNFPLFGSEK